MLLNLAAHQVVLVLGLLGVSTLLHLFGTRRQRVPYPPGPKGLPLIGNLLDIPTFKGWLAYMKMGKELSSDILHFSAFGNHIIVLNSLEDSVELLEKRASIYSDRPYAPVLDLMGWTWFLPLLPYGDIWRHTRRIFHQRFRKDVAHHFQPLQLKKVKELLLSLHSAMDEPIPHFQTIGGAINMQIAYDIDIKPPNDHYYKLAEKAVAGGAEVFLPGAALMNEMPFLRYLPSWVPGIGFQKAAAVKTLTDQMRHDTYAHTRGEMAKGHYTSLLAQLLEENDAAGGSEEVAKGVATSMYAACAVQTFFYQMALHPEIQRKAQTEIDLVIGTHRLPDFNDRPSLPYTDAIYHELLRLRPIFPLNLPHASIADDIYKGYFIPKGSMVFANFWTITRDENRFPDANKCLPERFLDQNGQLKEDMTSWIYGFGRRICPGRHLASSMLWLTFASVLATFNIHKSEGDTGSEEEVEAAYSATAISHPDFKCTLTPRSQEAIRLIHESY
ncbi:Cytochrome P450 [Amanita muscaria]